MNLNYCKEKILAGVCSITLLGVSPQAFAAGDEAPLPQAAQQADKKPECRDRDEHLRRDVVLVDAQERRCLVLPGSVPRQHEGGKRQQSGQAENEQAQPLEEAHLRYLQVPNRGRPTPSVHITH